MVASLILRVVAAVAFLATAVLPASANDPAAGAGTGTARPAESAGASREPGKGDAASGHLIGHGGPVKAVASDARRNVVLTGSFDYAMMAWDVSGEAAKLLHRFDDHDGAVNAVAFVPGRGDVLAAGDDGMLSVWSLEDGTRQHRFEGHTAKVVDIAVSDDGRFAATASWDRTARIWDLESRKPGLVLESHKGPVNAVVFSADGEHVFTASYDGEIRMFERATGTLVRPIYRHGWGINVLERLPDAEQLAFGALNGTAAIVDIASGGIVAELAAAERPILALSVTRQPGLVAVGGGDGKVSVFRLGDFKLIEEYENPYGPAWGLAFAPGGSALYIAGLDDFVSRWTVTPRAPFEPIDSPFPRRFQVNADSDDPVERGRAQFARKCSVCHTLKEDGKNRAGPTLYRLFGRRIASLPDYPYSESLKQLDIVWTAETVAKLFELGPEHYTPGSKMPLQKMTDKSQRDDLIAYLETTEAAAGRTQPDTADKKQPQKEGD